MTAVKHGTPLVDDPHRLNGVEALGERDRVPEKSPFDTVPTGAGLVKRIAQELDGVVDADVGRVTTRKGGEESSSFRFLPANRDQAL